MSIRRDCGANLTLLSVLLLRSGWGAPWTVGASLARVTSAAERARAVGGRGGTVNVGAGLTAILPRIMTWTAGSDKRGGASVGGGLVLSGYEHRRLREIERQLTKQDPELARQLSARAGRGAPGRWRAAIWRRLLLALTVLCGVSLIVGGGIRHHAVMSMFGMYLVLAAASRALSVLRP